MYRIAGPSRVDQRPPNCGRGYGFTLLEVLVVIIILTVLASMAVPRLSATTRKTFGVAEDQVADLLTVFAQRDHVGRDTIGLMYDPEFGRMELLILDRDASVNGAWRPDRFMPTVKLPQIVDWPSVEVIADGELLDVTTAPFAHSPGEDRPTIQIDFQSRDGDQTASISLPGHAITPTRRGERRQFARRAIDLDSAGQSEETW